MGNFFLDVVEYYKKLCSENLGVVYIFVNMEKEILENLFKLGSSIKWCLDVGIFLLGVLLFKDNIELSNIRVIVKEFMFYVVLEMIYLDKMLFYLYGNKNEVYFDYVLKVYFNVQISYEWVIFDLEFDLSDE